MYRSRIIAVAISVAALTACVSMLKPSTDTFKCGRFKFVDGVLQPVLSDENLIKEAKRRGIEAERVYYAPPAANSKGDLQVRYYNLFYPVGYPKGVIFYAHGGGGDVGSADGPDILDLCGRLAKSGYYTVNIEYRRGWTGTEPYDNFCQRSDPFNQPPENYVRQRESALQSFEDAIAAVTHGYDKIVALEGLKPPSWATGTSFGGAIASYIGYGTPDFASYINLQGVLNQFGALSMNDPVYSTVPYMGVGGVADDLVPFWDGPTYVNPESEWVYGTGGLGLKLKSMGQDTWIIGTCDAGHGRGATIESEIIKDLIKWTRDATYRPTEFYDRKGNTVDSCNYSWEELRDRRE